MKVRQRIVFLMLCLGMAMTSHAQVGEHRNDLSVGFNAGYVLSNVSFQPKVGQTMHGGITGGFTFKYVCEKYL